MDSGNKPVQRWSCSEVRFRYAEARLMAPHTNELSPILRAALDHPIRRIFFERLQTVPSLSRRELEEDVPSEARIFTSWHLTVLQKVGLIELLLNEAPPVLYASCEQDNPVISDYLVAVPSCQHPQLRVLDAKTEAGVRVVLVSPDLAEVLVEHIDRLRRAGQPTGPDDYLFPNTRGGRISRQRVAKIVSEAASLASERLRSKGLAPLPGTTPHTLRRTYISVALLANNFDVKWVMGQVGHSDSTMTMDVYAQLQQRADRQHGANLDRLIRKAKRQLAGVAVTTS